MDAQCKVVFFPELNRGKGARTGGDSDPDALSTYRGAKSPRPDIHYTHPDGLDAMVIFL
jgi:hypothetical protein